MKTINLIRHDFDDNPVNLTAQLPLGSTEDMMEIAAPLCEKLEHKRGLLYTCLFRWQDYKVVRDYYETLGYKIIDVDNRARDRQLRDVLSPLPRTPPTQLNRDNSIIS